MGKGFFQVPTAVNEPIKTYAPGTPEREEVLKTYKEMYKTPMDVPCILVLKK
jgi:1-pyrroline-5-carboxylate dehydrogenase